MAISKTIAIEIERLKAAEVAIFEAAKIVGDAEAGPIADLIQRRICSRLMECEVEITALRLALEKESKCSG